MITTICLNPCFDKTVEIDEIQFGQVNRLKNVRMDLGGKGLNVAIVAKRLGHETECLGIMGEIGSRDLTAMMDQEGLRHHFLTVPGRIRTNVKICTRDRSGVTELNEPGTPVNESQLNAFLEMAKEHTAGSDMVVLTGSLPPGCPPGTYRDMMSAIGNKKCVIDTEGKELEACVKAHPFLIKPNLKEMEKTLGIELRTMRAIRDGALLLIKLGAQHAVISMGAMGAMYVDNDKTLFAPALRVEARSTVGAGDAMIGGMLAGYETEGSIEKAFRYGVAAGAASVMTEGTQLIRKDDFEHLLDQVRIQEV